MELCDVELEIPEEAMEAEDDSECLDDHVTEKETDGGPTRGGGPRVNVARISTLSTRLALLSAGRWRSLPAPACSVAELNLRFGQLPKQIWARFVCRDEKFERSRSQLEFAPAIMSEANRLIILGFIACWDWLTLENMS